MACVSLKLYIATQDTHARTHAMFRIRQDIPEFKVIKTSRHVSQYSHGSCAMYRKDERKTVLAFVCCQHIQKCKMKEGESGRARRGGDDEALIEFESARIIVKRLKRPETNLFASESFLVEDNK